MPNWNGVPLPEPSQIKIPDSLPKNFNWNSYMSDPKGSFNKFRGAREVQRMNWKGYMNSSRQIKRVVASSPSRRFIAQAGKRIREIKEVEKKANEAKKTIDKVLEKVPGKGSAGRAANAGVMLGGLVAIAGLTVALVIKEFRDAFIQGVLLDSDDFLRSEIQKQFNNYIKQATGIKALEKQIADTNKKLANSIDKNYAESASATKNATKAREMANNALYETRQGRKILEGQISTASKKANDALYETRAGRQKLEAQITGIQTKLNQSLSSIGQGFQQQVNSTIANIQKGVQQAQTEARKANTQVEIQSRLISNLQATVNQVKNTAINSTQIVDTVINKVKDFFSPQIRELKNEVSTIKITFNKDIQQTNQNINQLGVTVNSYSGVADTLQATYSQSFDAKANQFYQEQLKVQSNFLKEVKTTTTTTTTTLDKTKQELDGLKAENGQIKNSLQDLEKQIKGQEKVNEQSNKKLDKIDNKLDSLIPTIAGIPLVVGKAADNIIKNIPTNNDIEKAAGTAMCKSLNGGCSGKALDDAIGNINNNANNNTNNVLNALGAASDVANLALLPIINNKLGDQLPGGIGGKLERFSKWLHLDRVLNMMIFAATVHNALMLSNDIAQTLLGAINNVLNLIPGLKGDDDQAFDLNSVINSGIENLIKGIVGADNYIKLKEGWEKANRIYQATINVVNTLQSTLSTVLNALEITLGRIGKIGNALRNSGEVLENAYSWMNPQPKVNRITQSLESLQNGASTIQMVTQAPLDIVNSVTELTNANTELVKAFQEDDKPENKGTEDKEPDQLKAVQAASKLASVGQEMIDSDLEPDED